MIHPDQIELQKVLRAVARGERIDADLAEKLAQKVTRDTGGGLELQHWSITGSINNPLDHLILKQLGYREPMNHLMAAGIAAESAVKEGLLDHAKPIEACANLALAKYDRMTVMKPNINAEARAKKRAEIPGMVSHAINLLRPLGKPEFLDGEQQKISITLTDVRAPLIGYLDFFYPEHGLIVDLKTTGRMPSKISDAHARQGAVYAAAKSNFQMQFCYATAREAKLMTQEDAAQRIHEVAGIALHRQRFFDLFTSWEEAARHVSPDYSSFYMSSPAMRDAGRQVWGF